jgi:aspartate/methionine/tyrosine aminotransferase
MKLSKRVLNELNTTSSGAKIWNQVTSLAASLGDRAINLGQGFPDHEINEVAKKKAAEALNELRPNQYSLISGDAELRTALGKFYKESYPSATELDINKNICITSSGTESLYCAIQSIVDEGDEVIVFEPFFPFYVNMIHLAGGVVKAVGLDEKNDFKINKDELLNAINEKTKLIIFNTPHNPTGHIATKDEIDFVSKLCINNNIFCIADEVYETFIFKNELKHHRIADEPGMENITVTVGSASKMFSVTGWRLGWVYTYNEQLLNGIQLIHGQTTYCAPTVFQKGVTTALEECDANINKDINDLYKGNADLLSKALKDKYNVDAYLPDGGYFLVCDISNCPISSNDVEFCTYLAKEKNIIAVPMQVFYHTNIKSNLVRFAICKSRDVIQKAVDAINA